MQLKGTDALMKKLQEIAEKMDAGSVSVGFMAGATYPDGTGVPQVAFWNEFGTVNSPPRPFFRGMISEESGTWPEKMAKLAKATKYDGEKVLALMGEDIGGALIQSIVNLQNPPLADATVKARIGKAKKYNPETVGKPLIDTGQMIRSIDYQVNENEQINVPYKG